MLYGKLAALSVVSVGGIGSWRGHGVESEDVVSQACMLSQAKEDIKLIKRKWIEIDGDEIVK